MRFYCLPLGRNNFSFSITYNLKITVVYIILKKILFSKLIKKIMSKKLLLDLIYIIISA